MGGLVLLMLAASGLLASTPSAAQAQGTRLAVHPKSQFWIHGKAASIDFTCAVDRVDGHATLPSTNDSIPPSADRTGQTEAVVTVPVTAFDCGNDRMTEDLQEALEAEAHPTIRFELVHATVGAPLDTTGHWRRVEVLGTLTIAGTKRLKRLRTVGRALDAHRFRVQGCHDIRMTYFNIEPPTKAFGLITVKNRVQVQFDLFAHAASLTENAPFASLSGTESPSSCSPVSSPAPAATSR
jgi:polyisoprenoid-binding protein YceI